MNQKQKSCPHPQDQWDRIPEEPARYQCQLCGVYGRRVAHDDPDHRAPRGVYYPWADGKLHPVGSVLPKRRLPRRRGGDLRTLPNASTDAPRAYAGAGNFRRQVPGEDYQEPPPEPDDPY